MFGGFDGLTKRKMGVNGVHQAKMGDFKLFWSDILVCPPKTLGYIHTLKTTMKNGEVMINYSQNQCGQTQCLRGISPRYAGWGVRHCAPGLWTAKSHHLFWGFADLRLLGVGHFGRLSLLTRHLFSSRDQKLWLHQSISEHTTRSWGHLLHQTLVVLNLPRHLFSCFFEISEGCTILVYMHKQSSTHMHI